MNTEYALLATYGEPIIPVKDVCEEFFSCKVNTANQKIKAFTFPIPAFRLHDKNSGDYFVAVEDLAEYIDHQFAETSSVIEQLFCLFPLLTSFHRGAL